MAPEVRSCAVLKVRSIAETSSWYASVGFELRETDEESFAEVAYDGLVLQFIAGATPWPESPCMTGTFYVHVGDVRAVHDAIRERVEVPWGVEERPWGAVDLTLRDPDGYHVTFTQPVG